MIETKTINGIVCRRCVDCGKWVPKKRGYCRCNEHQKIHNRKQNTRRNRKPQKPPSIKDYMSPEVIEKQLRGEGPKMKGLFEDCDNRQVEILKRGTVNDLLRYKDESASM